MPEPGLLITGADGYLGSRIARGCLGEPGPPVLLWVRAADPAALHAKTARILEGLGPEAASRVRVFGGDLGDAEPFAAVPPGAVDTIVHAAAVTRFSVDAETATRVNVAGTGKLLRFAERVPRLRAFAHLSTLYVSGLREGLVEETRFEEAGPFANEYERSKWEAEDMLLGRYPHLPWRIFRVGTAIADDDRGAVGQRNAFHATLRMLFYGLISLVPGNPRTPLYLVTGDFAAGAIRGILGASDDRAIYHVAHRREESASLGELIEIAFAAFSEDEDFRRRKLLPPLFTDRAGFDLLCRGLSGTGSAVVGQAVASMAPFAAQLFVDKDVRNRNLRERLPGYRAPDPRELARRVCAHLAATRWGSVTGAG